MDEDLQKTLSELVNKGNNGIDAASGFLTDELPDFISQLLIWHCVRAIIICMLFMIAQLVIVYIGARAARECKKTEGKMFANGVAYVASSILLIPVTVNFLVALKIWIAPKVWVIEYVAELAK